MPIVGFNFTSMNAERKEPVKGKININNNVSIKDVEEKELSLGATKQKTLRFVFEFTCKYTPNIGNISLVGDVLFMEDTKKIKEINDEWKKSKKLPKDVTARVLNSILGRCNVQALIMSEQVNLPAPIPMPKVQVDEGKK